MADSVTTDRIKVWSDPATSIDTKLADLGTIVARYSDGTFPLVDATVKQAFIRYVCSSPAGSSLTTTNTQLLQLNLQFLRIILRDKASADLDCFLEALKLLLVLAALSDDVGQPSEIDVTLEAEKCLVNLLFNSSKARDVFHDEPFEKVLARISAVNGRLLNGQKKATGGSGPMEYLNGWTQSQLEELLLYDLKITFVVTAQVRKLQTDCIADVEKTLIFQKVLASSLAQLEVNALPADLLPSTMAWRWLNEALKILFNFYHKAKLFDLDAAQLCAEECAKCMQCPALDAGETKQNAVNLLAVMPSTLPGLCPQIGPQHEKEAEGWPQQEGCDMRFVEALLRTFEQKIEQHERNKELTLAEYLAMFLTALNQLCTEHKAARRYCRLRVIPPLKARDVERRPDEGAHFRNKLVRLMMDTGRSGELAAEFLFVLCKRSVGRLIKYCGFGHSAGLLANYGFLGQALGPKHQSDSEDSETDEYKRVEEKINPVTGHIPPPGQLAELQRQLDSMSEEQKEYEVMKLVDAMDKLMDQGVIAPGTLDEDGRPRAVKHLAELVKDVKEEEEEDSD